MAELWSVSLFDLQIGLSLVSGLKEENRRYKFFFTSVFAHFYTVSSHSAGTSIEKVVASDADTGINSELVYRIEKGAFGDFAIDNKTGIIQVSSKLDYDRRSSYAIHIIAVDGGKRYVLQFSKWK